MEFVVVVVTFDLEGKLTETFLIGHMYIIC